MTFSEFSFWWGLGCMAVVIGCFAWAIAILLWEMRQQKIHRRMMALGRVISR